MPDFVKLFRAECSEIGLVLVEHSKAGLAALAKEGDDACVVTRYEWLPSWVDFISIAADRAVMALPAYHPLAEKRGIPAVDLLALPFLGYEGTSGEPVNQFPTRLAAQSAVDLAVSQEAESYMRSWGLSSQLRELVLSKNS